MEWNLLGYADCLYLVFQGCPCQLVGEYLEHLVRSVAANHFQYLVIDGAVHQFLGILRPQGDVHSNLTVLLYVSPFKLFNVALPQLCQAGEKEFGFQYTIFAVRIGKDN